MVSESQYLQEDELIRRALTALLQALGPVEMARFLMLPRDRSLDVVQRHREWQASLEPESFFNEVFSSSESA